MADATAVEVAERVARAADELSAAAALIPSCPCDQLDPERMGKVVADTARAEAAAAQVHSAFRELERAHTGVRKGMASLETQPLEGCVDCEPRHPAVRAGSAQLLAEQAGSEQTGGQL